MWRSRGGPAAAADSADLQLFRRHVAAVSQEAAQRGAVSVDTLAAAINGCRGLRDVPLAAVADGLVLLGQQLSSSLSSTKCSSNSSSKPGASAPTSSAHQATACRDVLQACAAFCEVVAAAVVAGSAAQQLRKWQPQHKQAQQPQQAQLLPAPVATALCSCLRQWANASPPPAGSSACCCQQQQDTLQLAAVSALGALLPQQLPAVAAYERAAVVTMLLALAQPPWHSSSGGSLPQLPSQAEHQQQHSGNDWTLSCTAVTALAAILGSNSSGTGSAVQATSGKASASSASGLHAEEVDALMGGLVEALGTACGIRNSSSSGGGSRHSSLGGSSSGAAAAAAAAGGASSSGGGDGGSSSSRHLPSEGVHQSRYLAGLLTALNQLVSQHKSSWQSHAGSLTEAARKLLTYGTTTQQQQQPAQVEGAGSSVVQQAVGATIASSAGSPGKPRYVPPHMRGGSAAAAAATPPLQQQQQDLSDESEQSASDWSDTEGGSSSSSRRQSSASSGSRSAQQLKQQQQQAHDPIRGQRVRVALLQLLQALVRVDPKALHPYWPALLPSQSPVAPRPLSPHLVTVLLFDPSDKVRLLAAAVLGALLEGPAARALLAVAEARMAAHTPVRGFTTLSVSLGQLLLSLHTGLLAVLQAWQQQQQPGAAAAPAHMASSRPPHTDSLPAVPSVLLAAVLRVLCALVPVTPYERMPRGLLTDLVGCVWQLWQQQQLCRVAMRAKGPQANGAASNLGSCVPPWPLQLPAPSAAAPDAGDGNGQQQQQQQRAPGAAASGSSEGSGIVASVAVLAQALSTKKPHAALSTWLVEQQQQQSTPISCFVAAAGSRNALLRIEALAALRGCCINYPDVLLRLSLAGSSSSGDAAGGGCWSSVMQAAQLSVTAASAAAASSTGSTSCGSPAGTPRGTNGPAAAPAAAAAAGGDVSGSTSPEVKAGQHAIRLLGNWLTAGAGVPADGAALCAAWFEVLQLLLSEPVWQHASPVIRAAAATVAASVPAAMWRQQQLPAAVKRSLLAATAAAASGDAVTAVRAAACKALGSLAVLPGALQQEQEQQELLQALARCVSDDAVSVRLNAAWALAAVCDHIRQQQQQEDEAAAAAADHQQQHASQANGTAAAAASAAAVMDRGCLQVLCNAALAAAGDTEKVRCHGVRAVGALLEAWRPQWLAAGDSTSSGGGGDSAADWMPGWLRSACASLQSCLAARSMKVVWNAACGAAAALDNRQLLEQPAVATSSPSLLLILVVLVRDSSNYKIKTHAAAALAALRSRPAYGDAFADSLLVLVGALEALQGSSSNSTSSSAASAAHGGSTSMPPPPVAGDAGGDEDGAFPNFRYIPGLTAQLELSLLHMLALAQRTDAARLRLPLSRSRQLLQSVVDKHAAGCTVAAGAAGAAGQEQEGGQQLPADPFAQGESRAGSSSSSGGAGGCSSSSQAAGANAVKQEQQAGGIAGLSEPAASALAAGASQGLARLLGK